MQWLIELVAEKVIAEIGIPPCFVKRGDPAGYDYVVGNFTKNSAWHDLNLSAIVPAGATAVYFILNMRSTLAYKRASFRAKGDVNEYCRTSDRNSMANMLFFYNIIIPCDSNRVIQYWIQNTPWPFFSMAVMGWWL